MTPISFNYQFGTQSYIQPDKNTGPAQKQISGQLFYGADGQQAIPDVAGVNKDGAERSHGHNANGQESSLAGNKSPLAENKSILGKAAEGECQTCANRKYQDGSNDPGVSFKTATKLSPEEAATAVRSHENEHVVRNQAKAEREGREVVSSSVTLHTAICPECGDPYISGGTTRTVTRAADQQPNPMEERFNAGQKEEVKGRFLDMTA